LFAANQFALHAKYIMGAHFQQSTDFPYVWRLPFKYAMHWIGIKLKKTQIPHFCVVAGLGLFLGWYIHLGIFLGFFKFYLLIS